MIKKLLKAASVLCLAVTLCTPVCKCAPFGSIDRDLRSIHVIKKLSEDLYAIVLFNNMSERVAEIDVSVLGGENNDTNIPIMCCDDPMFNETSHAIMRLNQISKEDFQFITDGKTDVESLRSNLKFELYEVIYNNLHI